MADFVVSSPKQVKRSASKWERMFPYYAGFSESFVSSVLKSSSLPIDGLVYDPWNGSGTTTTVASQIGFRSIGVDINPVMTLIAKSRSAYIEEVDAAIIMYRRISKNMPKSPLISHSEDPLSNWFDEGTISYVRTFERQIAAYYDLPHLPGGVSGMVGSISTEAAVLYTCLFVVMRTLDKPHRSSNPTWIKKSTQKTQVSGEEFDILCSAALMNIKEASAASNSGVSRHVPEIINSDSTHPTNRCGFADIVITSPPYCTRIDYTAATRINLAVLGMHHKTTIKQLSQKMLGSINAPKEGIGPLKNWGEECNTFLERVREHGLKASSSYYYKTHTDYYDKLFRSLKNISDALMEGGTCVVVVQDSFYKEVHNNLSQIVIEMADYHALRVSQVTPFSPNTTMAHRNPVTRTLSPRKRTECVLALRKQRVTDTDRDLSFSSLAATPLGESAIEQKISC